MVYLSNYPMGQRYKNDDIRTAISNSMYLDGYSDHVPAEISNFIQPVVDVTPTFNRITNFYASNQIVNGTTATISTVSTSVDTYLNCCQLMLIKDAGNTGLVFEMTATSFDGTALVLIFFPGISATAQQNNMSISFPTPIKLKRGSTIGLATSSGTANISLWGAVWGYTVDTNIYDSGATNPQPKVK